ncbi:hypothetical protein DUNSADRAFT_13930 [Dunaliella salina]|uniref:Guanylate cyclase domain-containing protein n=1 Tax=Dunaliella salina TaxID=3046 RepID=A0ABQ7G8E5_DUNSA|nr:hypothetical protein DUNSADRAFT_13930 [Dunaliella salina]|eukprot:KAF5830870.1 hypothetical protein DUNSADRAFT_13930 [Dunaliella salina]
MQDCPELQDVFQFGRGIVQLHTASMGFSSSGVLDKPEEMVEGSAMTIGTFSELERTRGRGFAVLLRECCSMDHNMRPAFTQIVERLESLESEVMQAAQDDNHGPPVTLLHNSSSLSRRSFSMGPGTQNKAKHGADSLLHELFPAKVAEALKSGRSPDPEPFPSISLFFSDVVGYTDLCSKLAPEEIMDMLHRLYSRFDTLAQSLKLFKGVDLIQLLCARDLTFARLQGYKERATQSKRMTAGL